MKVPEEPIRANLLHHFVLATGSSVQEVTEITKNCFFTQLYSVNMASANELFCKDFFLYSQTLRYGLFATSTAQIYDSAPSPGAVPGIPSTDKINFLLVRLGDGVILYDDLFAILSLRHQKSLKKFYFHFQDYVDMISWKVSRSADHHPASFAVNNMETTDIVAFYQNSAEDLYQLFEQFSSTFTNFVTWHSNSVHALEQFKYMQNKSNSFFQLSVTEYLPIF